MKTSITKDRKLAAKLARQLYSGEINFTQFMMNYPEFNNDDDIDELYSLIEHEPKKGGLLGISSSLYDSYVKKVFQLIEILEKD